MKQISKRCSMAVLALTLCFAAPANAYDGTFLPNLHFPKDGVFTGFLSVDCPKDKVQPDLSDK